MINTPAPGAHPVVVQSKGLDGDAQVGLDGQNRDDRSGVMLDVLGTLMQSQQYSSAG